MSFDKEKSTSFCFLCLLELKQEEASVYMCVCTLEDGPTQLLPFTDRVMAQQSLDSH